MRRLEAASQEYVNSYSTRRNRTRAEKIVGDRERLAHLFIFLPDRIRRG